MPKVLGLDNHHYTWNISTHQSIERQCSNLHIRARKLLKEIFPYDIIHEEISLPGTKTRIRIKPLIADFYIHSERLIIEVHGEQHYTFVPYFFDNKRSFAKAQQNDSDKIKWCKLNNITMVVLPYTETDDEWRDRILNR